MTYVQRASDDPSFVLVKPADTWSEAEVLLFMAGRLDADGQAIEGPLTAAAEVHTGAMIALLPTDRDARRLAVPGGEPIDQLHVTLMYLGEAAAWSLDQRVTLEMQLERYLDILSPVEGEGFAIAIFNPPGNGRAEDGMDRETCIPLVCSGASLAVVHDYVTRGVRDVADELGPIPPQHSPWVPHITLAYTEDLELATQLAGDGKTVGPVTFDRVRIAFGGENHDIPLNGTLTASAEMIEAAFWKKADHPRNPKDGEFIEKDAGVGEVAKQVDSIAEMMKAARESVRPKIETGDHPFLQRARTATSGADAYDAPAAKIAGGPAARYAYVDNAQRINADLRAGRTPSGDDGALVDALDGQMKPLPSDVLAFRGVGDVDAVFGDAAKGDLTGREFTDPGFVSTSADPGFPAYLRKGLGQSNAAEMRIIVPKGTPAVRGSGKAHEIVLGRGLRYRIARDRGVVDGVRQLDVEVLP